MKGFFVFGTPALTVMLQNKEVNALLDTGFTGQLMLPEEIIDKLKLEQIGVSDYLMASGEGRVTNVYRGAMQFFNEEKEIIVLSTDADFSLAGMDLFHDCKIIIERHKGNVEVTKTR